MKFYRIVGWSKGVLIHFPLGLIDDWRDVIISSSTLMGPRGAMGGYFRIEAVPDEELIFRLGRTYEAYDLNLEELEYDEQRYRYVGYQTSRERQSQVTAGWIPDVAAYPGAEAIFDIQPEGWLQNPGLIYQWPGA